MDRDVVETRIYIPSNDTGFYLGIVLSVPFLYAFILVLFYFLKYISGSESNYPWFSLPAGYAMYLILWLPSSFELAHSRKSVLKRCLVAINAPLLFSFVLFGIMKDEVRELATQQLAERMQPAVSAYLETYLDPPTHVYQFLPPQRSWHSTFAKPLHFYYEYLAYYPSDYDIKLIRFYDPELEKWRTGRLY